MRIRELVVLAALAVVAASCAGAEVAAEQDEGAIAAGIGVEGEWTIAVYDSDGTLQERVEFHNALTSYGSQILTQLLTRQSSAGHWLIRVDGQSGQPGNEAPGVCLDPASGAVGPCFMIPPEVSFDYPKTLEVTTFVTSFNLDGSFTAARTGTIIDVSTGLGGCGPTIAPAGCNGLTFEDSNLFTETTLPTPVDVAEGQTVSVSVEISFGTLTP